MFYGLDLYVHRCAGKVLSHKDMKARFCGRAKPGLPGWRLSDVLDVWELANGRMADDKLIHFSTYGKMTI